MAEHAPAGPELVSIIVPVYNESENIVPMLEALRAGVGSPHETLLVYDFDEDTTLPPARRFAEEYPQLGLVRNSIGRGVLNALKAGLGAARGDVLVVTMADMSDDPSQIDQMAGLVRDGASVVAASRYMRGGKQVGGPFFKSLLSRLAGLSLRWLTRLGTHDATNNFKAYSRDLIDSIDLESTSGFELALEITTKAHLSGRSIREIPTTWRDRTAGESGFNLVKWLPGYLRWYGRCVFGTWRGERSRAIAETGRSRSSQPRSAAVSKE